MTDSDRADTLEAIIQQLTYCLSEVEQANVPIAAVLIDAGDRERTQRLAERGRIKRGRRSIWQQPEDVSPLGARVGLGSHCFDPRPRERGEPIAKARATPRTYGETRQAACRR